MADEKDSATIDVARRQWNRYARARDGHRKYLDAAERQRAFYRGDQWSEADLQKLREQGRPALTINQILPTINTMLGEQAANRADIRFKPRRNGDDDGARVLQKVAQAVMDENQYPWRESDVFADGLIEDRGYFDIRINFDRNIFGDIEITVLDPSHVIPDPDASTYDPKYWNEVFVTWWMSLDDIEANYGREKASEVRANGLTDDYAAAEDSDSYRYRKTFSDSRDPVIVPEGLSEEHSVRSVRVVERQHRVRDRAPVFITQYGDIRPVPEAWTGERARAHAQAQGYYLTEQPRSRVRWTVTAGENVVLHDDWSPYEDLTVVPFFPYYRRGTPFGVVRNLISPQEQLNKLESQELHIINTTANSGWIIPKNSLADGKTAADVEKEGSKTGFVLEYNQGFDPPQKIQPNQVPTGVDRMSAKTEEAIRSISGIHQAMQGNASPEMSGRALSSQISRGQVQMQKPLDNLARTRHLLAERMLNLIQTYYTEERVVYITNDLEPEGTEQQMVINQQTVDGVLNDVTLGEYSIVVSQQPARDSYRDTQMSEAMGLREMGVSIPDWILVRYSNLEGRNELADLLKQAAGQAEPTPEQQQMAQFQQQAQVQDIRLSLAKKEAELEKITSEIRSMDAKTATESNPQAFQNVFKLLQLQADVQKERENLNARLAMSQASNMASEQRAQLQGSVQARGQDLQQETAITTAMLNNAAQENRDRTTDSTPGE